MQKIKLIIKSSTFISYDNIDYTFWLIYKTYIVESLIHLIKIGIDYLNC